ncbi:MAG: hypothetical protein KAW17_04725 [Candidatus Eisenbacteria sp.]|nr:hypothetical protein [Candidatus Eisenbacteria bacterium]
MRWKIVVFVVLAAGVGLTAISCIDESPTKPAVPPVYFPLNPGTQWTYQVVLNDSTGFWMTALREEPVVVLGDTVWALDYIDDGRIAQTQYVDMQDGLVYLTGARAVFFADTIVEVYEPPLRLSPEGHGPGETWSSVGTSISLKITSAVPPDTIRTEGSFTWMGRVLAEERIEVPAFDEPLNALLVEYVGEWDPWASPGAPQYTWFVEDIGPVRRIELYMGRTVSNLSEFIQGK